MTQSDATSAGLSRRDLLKRGAVVGATVAWTVPLVQVVSMTPAHADSPSAPPVNPPPTNPPPTNPPPVNPPPTNPPVTAHHPAPPAAAHHPAPQHAAAAPHAAGVGSVPARGPAAPAGGSALANTGATYPVAPTVGAGVAAIALGAGALTAAHALKKRQESSSDA
jgi:hypothetical protein